MRQTALVTGASSGMGLEYARQLASMGYDLIIISNQQEQLDRVALDLSEKFGVSVTARFQDLSLMNAAEDILSFCEAEHIKIEILVNNAGMFFFEELQSENIQKVEAMLKLHTMAITKLSVLFGEKMKERGHGHILIMASMAARLPVPGITIYSATKAYLKSFGKSLYFEMKPYGVGVTTVCPAAIATPLYRLKEQLMNLGIKFGVIKRPEWLVHRALKRMFRNRRLVQPGFMNVYLPMLIRLLPEPIEMRIWNKLKK